MTHRHAYRTLALVALLGVTVAAIAQQPDDAANPPGWDANRHLRVSEVRPGMKGYGMTVFHGVDPEPFAVEVVSVERGFAPGKSVVWVRCPDARMQLTGPVQGMSGSPIYLWPKGQDGKLGEGGKLIGAFAFGHSLGKDCYVGVQPIEQMLMAATRATVEQDAAGGEAKAAGPGPSGTQVRLGGNERASSVAMRDQTLAASFEAMDRLRVPAYQTWRLRALAELAGFDAERVKEPTRWANRPFDRTPLSVPVSVGSDAAAAVLEPFFRRAGLRAVAGGLRGAGESELAPDWIDPAKVKVVPGGVFAIPLTFGPLDMAAVGTTTEVLADGTALAFGHQFFAQGPIRVPMAPGFVHFIQPNLQASFKLGGSLGVTGAVIRDESTAVVGKPGLDFPTAPVTVRVHLPGKGLDRTYEYRVVRHPQLLAALVGAVVVNSMTSDVEPPPLNTATVKAKVAFANGRSIAYTSVMPGAAAERLAIPLVPMIGMLTESEFGATALEGVEVDVTLSHEVRSATITDVSLKQTPVEPGGKLIANVTIQPFRGEPMLKTVEIDVPNDLPDGTYTLSLGGAEMYNSISRQMRPHLMRVTTQAQLFEAVEQQLAPRDDALYATLELSPANNVAIGRTELPHLPSSKAALLEVAGSTRTTRFADYAEKIVPLDYVVVSQMQMPVEVKEKQND